MNSGDLIHFNRTGVQYLGKTYLSGYWRAAKITYGPAPGITGIRKVGSVLSAVPGTWGPAPVALTYRWYRSGTAISDAYGASYRLRSEMREKPSR